MRLPIQIPGSIHLMAPYAKVFFLFLAMALNPKGFKIKLIANRWNNAYLSGQWFQGEQQALRYKTWVGHAGIRGNSKSGNHPLDTITLTKSVEILTSSILTKSTNEGVKEREIKHNKRTLRAWNKLHNLTWLEHTARVIRETPHVTLRRMIPWPPLTSIGLISS